MEIETLIGLRFPDDYVIMSRASQKVTGTKHLQFPAKKPEQLLSTSHTNEGIMEPEEANNYKSFFRSKESVSVSLSLASIFILPYILAQKFESDFYRKHTF